MSLVSSGTTDGTPEDLERSVGGLHKFIMTCKSSACPTAPPEGKLGTTLRVDDGSLVSPGNTAGTSEGFERSVVASSNEVDDGSALSSGTTEGTSDDLEISMGAPINEVRAFACALSAFFEVCRRVSVSLVVSRVPPRAAKRFP